MILIFKSWVLPLSDKRRVHFAQILRGDYSLNNSRCFSIFSLASRFMTLRCSLQWFTNREQLLNGKVIVNQG